MLTHENIVPSFVSFAASSFFRYKKVHDLSLTVRHKVCASGLGKGG